MKIQNIWLLTTGLVLGVFVFSLHSYLNENHNYVGTFIKNAPSRKNSVHVHPQRPPKPVTRNDLLRKWFPDLGEVSTEKKQNCLQLLRPAGKMIYTGTYNAGKAEFDTTLKIQSSKNQIEGHSAQVAAQVWVG